MADKTFELNFMASDHTVYSGEASLVNLPTTEGRAGILAHHSNVIMAVVPGMLEFVNADGIRESVVVSGGLCKVESNTVMILVNTAERPDEIDEARAERAEESARRELARAASGREHTEAEAKLARALSRLNASRSRQTRR